jgi:hypothetical protein
VGGEEQPVEVTQRQAACVPSVGDHQHAAGIAHIVEQTVKADALPFLLGEPAPGAVDRRAHRRGSDDDVPDSQRTARSARPTCVCIVVRPPGSTRSPIVWATPVATVVTTSTESTTDAPSSQPRSAQATPRDHRLPRRQHYEPSPASPCATTVARPVEVPAANASVPVRRTTMSRTSNPRFVCRAAITATVARKDSSQHHAERRLETCFATFTRAAPRRVPLTTPPFRSLPPDERDPTGTSFSNTFSSEEGHTASGVCPYQGIGRICPHALPGSAVLYRAVGCQMGSKSLAGQGLQTPSVQR